VPSLRPCGRHHWEYSNWPLWISAKNRAPEELRWVPPVLQQRGYRVGRRLRTSANRPLAAVRQATAPQPASRIGPQTSRDPCMHLGTKRTSSHIGQSACITRGPDTSTVVPPLQQTTCTSTSKNLLIYRDRQKIDGIAHLWPIVRIPQTVWGQIVGQPKNCNDLVG
jgi:hypothetical protein